MRWSYKHGEVEGREDMKMEMFGLLFPIFRDFVFSSFCSCLRKWWDQQKWMQFPAKMNTAHGSTEKRWRVFPKAQLQYLQTKHPENRSRACIMSLCQSGNLQVFYLFLRKPIGKIGCTATSCGGPAKSFYSFRRNSKSGRGISGAELLQKAYRSIPLSHKPFIF